MGLITRSVARVAADTLHLKSYKTSPQRERELSAIATNRRRLAKSTPELYRQWAIHAPFVRTAMDIRLGQLVLAEWDLVPFDRNGPTPDPGLMRRIRELIEMPNPSGESFGTFLWSVGEDILALDAGSVEKERMLKDELCALWPTDGAKIAVDRFWSGDPRSPRYYWVPQPTVEVPLLNRDLIYMMTHRRTYEPIGVSILETLKMSIEAELGGSIYNARQITSAAPDGILDMGENARPEQITSFRSYFESELAGRGMIGFWGGTKGAKFIPFRGSNKEAQFMEFLIWEARKVAIGFQLSPQDLGLLHDVNRANAEVQQENTEDRGQKVFLATVQDYLTTEVCWDDRYGGRRNNIRFKFRATSDRASKRKAEELKIALAGMPYESINGGRIAVGLPPIGDPNDQSNPFNMLMANTPLGLATIDLVPNARELVESRNKNKEGEEGQAEGGEAESKPEKKEFRDLITWHRPPDAIIPEPVQIQPSTTPDLALALTVLGQQIAGIAKAGPGPDTALTPEEEEVGRRERFMEFLAALDEDDKETEERIIKAVEERFGEKFTGLETMIREAMGRPIALTVENPPVQVHVPAAPPPVVHVERSAVRKTVTRDPVTREITSVTEETVPDAQ